MNKINGNILKWARESAGLSLEDAVHKLYIKDTKKANATEKLSAYERDEKPLSHAMLVKMSKQYRRPLLTFYLPKPPINGDRGEDFRTLPTDYQINDNALVDTLLREIKARQSIVRSALIDEDEAEPISFIGSSNINDSWLAVAELIIKTIDFDLNEFREKPTVEKAFNLLRSKIEDTGVFVLLAGNLGSHHTNIDVKLFRGFVLSDNIAPFIVINDQDSKVAWSFTILHELAHIWLGKTGISGAYSEKVIEKFCNDVASEILLPDAEFSDFQVDNLDFDILKEQISEFAYPRKLSNRLVAYRLFRQDVINKHTWTALNNFYIKQGKIARLKQRERNSERSGGPNYFVVRRHKLGNALVGLVQRLTDSGTLTPTKAGMVLGVKPLKVHKLFEPSVASKVTVG